MAVVAAVEEAEVVVEEAEGASEVATHRYLLRVQAFFTLFLKIEDRTTELSGQALSKGICSNSSAFP